MASSNNSVTKRLKGSLGKELVFRVWDGKTIVSKHPGPRKGDASPAQAANEEKFLLAALYAKAIFNSTDQSFAEAYASALKPRQNVYARATQDFLHCPVVKSIDTSTYKGIAGDKITIRAADDFRVTGVQVEIFSPNGAMLEKGDAVQFLNGIDWTYATKQLNNLVAGSTIKAIAFDIPGNEGSLETVVS